MTRHVKPRKPDNLLASDLVKNVEAQRVQSAVWHFDQAINRVEKTWGVDRLPYLVDQDLRLKWWQAVEQMNDAIKANDSELTKRKVEACLRGLERLVGAAEAAGHQPLPAEVWETALEDDTVLRVVNDYPPHSMAHIASKVEDPRGRKVVTWSLTEVANVVRSMRLVNKVKEHWPDAEVQPPRQRPILEEALNDAIPF